MVYALPVWVYVLAEIEDYKTLTTYFKAKNYCFSILVTILKKLTNIGMLEKQKVGRVCYYKLTDAGKRYSAACNLLIIISEEMK